jgi:CRP-like cAMP-binding protein
MPSISERVDQLRTVELFHALTAAQLQRVARVADEIALPAGRKVVEERTYRDSGGASFYLILQGKADVTARGKRLARLRDGDTFGEMSLLDGKPRSATVTAATDLRLYRIRSWDFQRLVKTEPAIALGLLKTLAGRLRDMEAKKTRTR